MNKTTILTIAITVALLCPLLVSAQEDPVEAQRQRNAALEAVSPVLEREENYVPTPAEQIEAQFGAVRRNAVLINEILEDISKMGDQVEQATLLTQLNPDSLSVIRELIELEKKRVESFGQSIPLPATATPASAVVEPAPRPLFSPKDKEVTVMMVRPYTSDDKPTKVILRVGEGTPKAYFVGETVAIAGRDYEVRRVDDIGPNPKIKGRSLYRIELVHGTDRRLIEW